ncbi:MAG: aminoglycoside phosphotransferase family protein [Candidatus Nanoarchaeia archaeon]|jgi:aminoglycoside phosphotransferase (APT) family kinase protein
MNSKAEIKKIITGLGYELSSLERLSGGYSNDVFEANTNKGDYIVRAGKDVRIADYTLEKTLYFYNKLKKVGAMKAKIIDSGKLSSGNFYFIMEKVPGVVMSNLVEKHKLTKEEIYELFKDAIKAAKNVSKIKMKGFGTIIRQGKEYVGMYSSEKKEAKAMINNLDFLKNENVISQDFYDSANNVIKKNMNLLDSKYSKLVFPDLHFGNIIVENKKFKGLIDFDWLISGNPLRTYTSDFSFIYNPNEFDDIHTLNKDVILKAMNFKKDDLKKAIFYCFLGNIGDGLKYTYEKSKNLSKKDLKKELRFSLGAFKGTLKELESMN